jgi:NAD(P)H dehydrogenase (quinone)
MSLLVTGASGAYGRSVIDHLLAAGVPAASIVAGARTPSSIDDLAARGVVVRRVDYDDAASIVTALDGVDRVLLVSGTEFGRRVAQHTAVAQAASDAGVQLLVYTSAPHADATPLGIAQEHAATEAAIRSLGVAHTFLRNGWYFENYTAQIPTYVELGAVYGSARDGRISGAARTELAEAGARVLTGDGHEGRTYELGGDQSFTMTQLAAAVADASGRPITYQDLPVEQFETILVGAGLPGPVAATLAQADDAIAQGALEIHTGDLSRLLGRATTTITDAVRGALAPTA